MLLEESNIRLDRTLLVRPNIGFVVIEVNVLHALREQLLLGRSGCSRRWWRRRLGHSDACRCLLRSPSSFRSQRVGSRIRRGYLLRAAGLYSSNSVNAYIGGIRRL